MLLAQGFLLQDRYRIEALLGRGGMGAVYKATDMRLGHTVAIKQNLFETVEGTAQLSHPTRPDDTVARRAQFEREARLLASLKHSGLAKVTDYFFVTGEGQYLVMDFIDGQDFGAVVQQLGALREEHAAGFIIEIAQVLEYLHDQSPPVIHRDIKPANIRVTPQGQVFLVDFGVAKVGTGEKTMFGAQAVTPGFSPLEQFGGDKPTDQRADIYSLAATLYALTIGKPPPSAIDILRGKALFDSDSGAGLRPALVSIVQRGMALEPEDRYASMAQFREALSAAFPERTQKSQSSATVNLVTQIYTQPMQSPGSEMGVIGLTGSPDTGVPIAGAPPTTGSRGGAAPPPAVTQPHQPTARPAAPTMPQPPSVPPPASYTPPPAPPAGHVPQQSAAYDPGPGAPTPVSVPAPREKKGISPVVLAVGLTVALAIALFLGRDLITNMFGGSKPGGTTPPVSVADNSPAEPNRPVPSVPPPTDGSAAIGGSSGTAGTNVATGAGNPVNDTGSRPIETPVVTPPTSPAPAPIVTPRNDPPASPPASNTNNNPPANSVPAPKTPVVTPPTTNTIPSTPVTSPPAATPSLGAQIVVSAGGDGQFRTLEEALQAHYDSGASQRRTITLKSGTYRLPPDMVLHTPIEIVGDGSVVLQGSGNTAAFRIRQPGITLRDLTITSSAQYGVLVVGSGAVTIQNCTITNSREAALALTETGRATASNCTLSGANFGVITDGASEAVLTGSTISGNGIGAQARAGSTIRLTGGTVARSRQSGMLVSTGGTIIASNVTISDNGGNGVTARSGRITLNGGTVTNNAQFGTVCESATGVINKAGVTLVGNKMGDTQGCP